MSDYSNSSTSLYIISIFSIILSIVMTGVAIYAMIRVGTVEKKVEFATNENKGRIGRLIRELNIIHQSKREIDYSQNQKIMDMMDMMDKIQEES